jgi:hypothetical protein
MSLTLLPARFFGGRVFLPGDEQPVGWRTQI